MLCLMAMAGLRQPKQLNNNAAPLNPYLLTLCLRRHENYYNSENCCERQYIAIEVLRSFGDQDSLSTFNEPRSPPEDITNVEV